MAEPRRFTNATVACVAAATLLLQQLLALPLAMQTMPASHGYGFVGTLCALRTAAGGTPAWPPLPPARPHSNFGCAICAGHAVPPGILATSLQLRVPVTTWQRWLPAAGATPAPVRPFRLYGSRAPPAAA